MTKKEGKSWSVENEKLKKALRRNKILLVLISFLLFFGMFALILLVTKAM